MPNYQIYQALADWVPALFVFAFGACVGSLINVIAYRLPLGIGIVSPPSRCPSCQTRLTWRENIPVLGWLMLKGRCRFCRSPISAEYPSVEAITGALFLVVYGALYLIPTNAVVLGVPIGDVRPDWANSGASGSWPIAAVWLILTGSLVAMTITDLKTYTIPLVLTWAPAITAGVVFPLFALALGSGGLRRVAPGAEWSIPVTGDWGALAGVLGAMLGLLISNLLLASGLLKRSFEDYDEWEREALAAHEGDPDAGEAGPDAPEMWIQYPHARREMVRELAFLGPVVLLGYLGLQLGGRFGADAVPALWLQVLGGVGLGFLVGGAVVWGVRILGSLVFGKEAMGLGDVHLLAGVGACLGWIDTILVFFTAVFVGLGLIVGVFVTRLLRGEGGSAPRLLAFGPWLAMGTLLVMLGKPVYEWFLGLLFHQPGGVNLP